MVYLRNPNWQRDGASASGVVAESVFPDEERIWREVQRAARFLTFDTGGDWANTRIYRFTTGTDEWRACAVRLREAADASGVVVVVIQRDEPRLPSVDELRRRFGLTAREAEVALMLAERKSNKEIARELLVTEHTARRHTERVLQKLGINSRTDVRVRLLGLRSDDEMDRPARLPGNGVFVRRRAHLPIRANV